jgi:hypothetical protein
MQLTSFLQNSSGDWDLTRGLRRVPDRATYVRQNLSVTFNFWFQEWFLDRREGIDYFRLVWGTKFDRRLLTALFHDAAVATTGVGSVDSLELRYDNVARVLYVDFAGTTDQGDDISGPFIVGVAQGAIDV